MSEQRKLLPVLRNSVFPALPLAMAALSIASMLAFCFPLVIVFFLLIFPAVYVTRKFPPDLLKPPEN